MIYRLWLHNETFHRFNRIYLICALVLPLVLPAVQFSYLREVYIPQNALNGLPVADSAFAATQPPAVGWQEIVLCIYAAGAALVLGLSIMRLVQIRRLRSCGESTRYDGYELVELTDSIAPFSFIDWIFINLRERPEVENRIIIAHELGHIRGRHWVDLALAKVVQVVMWFNPLLGVLVRDMRRNHEYMVDREVIGQGNSKAVYQAVLINNSLGGRVFALGHPFSSPNNLKRYEMMNRRNSHPARKWFVLALVPVAAAVFAAFAQPEYKIVEVAPVVTPEYSGATGTEVPQVAPADTVGQEERIKVRVKPGSGETGSLKVTKRTTESVVEAEPLILVDGIEVSATVLDGLSAETVKSVTVLKDSISVAVYGRKGRNGAIIVETNKFPDKGDAKPGIRIVKSNSDGSAGLWVVNSEGEIVEYGGGSESVAEVSAEKGKSVAIEVSGKKGDIISGEVAELLPLVIINEVESDIVTLNALDRSKVESITVLKDETAVKLYGQKGKNGVIVVKLKK